MGRGGAKQGAAGTGGARGKTEPEPSLGLVAWRPTLGFLECHQTSFRPDHASPFPLLSPRPDLDVPVLLGTCHVCPVSP